MGQNDQLSRSELFVTNLAAGITGTPAKSFLKEYGLRGGFQALAGFLGDGRDPERTATFLRALDGVLEAETTSLYEHLRTKAREEETTKAKALESEKRAIDRFGILAGVMLLVAAGYTLAYLIHVR